MAQISEYNKALREKRKKKLKSLEKKLPVYVKPYLDEKELVSQINTVISYAYDLITFFSFLQEENPMAKDMDIKDIPPELLEELTFEDINEYQRYLSYNEGIYNHMNEDKGIARRMAALRGFFEFATTHHYLKNNPTIGAAKRKKMPKKDIVRLNNDEINEFMRVIEESAMSSSHQRSYCARTRLRDTAILTLLLNTGIRVSECVGLNVDEINFKENSLQVTRKGGNIAKLYFNDRTGEALTDYIENERNNFCASDDEKALFLSGQKKRISVRSVQNMVKKYAKIAVPDKNISPHKMRSTYGTALYKSTGDIRLVADVLGHSDINTTAKHYAAMEDEHRRRAAQVELYDE